MKKNVRNKKNPAPQKNAGFIFSILLPLLFLLVHPLVWAPSRIFSLIQLSDFVSFYLAILNKEDPTPVKVIDLLKNELAKQE